MFSSRSVLTVFALLLGACGGARSAGSAKTPPSTSPTASVSEPAPPSSALQNVRRDRRAEPGVRAAPKPLVQGNPSSVKCGKITKAPSDAEVVDLLGGRLRIRPPALAKALPPAEGAPADEESRLVVDGGKLSLAIAARETFQLDTDLYEAEAGAPHKPASLDVEAGKFLKATFPSEEPLEIVPVQLGKEKLRAYAARPAHPNAPPGKDTALVLALLIAREEGELESVGFYVRGETVRNATGDALDGCTRLAERIASTIAPGSRALERAPGRRKIAELPEGELTMTVPPDYVTIPTAAGARITKLRPLSLFAGSINVSVVEGVEKKVPEGAETTLAGNLLGRSIEWRGKTSPKGGFLFAMEPATPDSKKLVEILIKATRQPQALDEMRAIAETAELVKK